MPEQKTAPITPDIIVAEQPPITEITEHDLASVLWAQHVYRQLTVQGAGHTGQKGPFTPIEFDPHKQPGQLLSEVRIPALGTEGVEEFIAVQGEEFQPGFSSLVECFSAQPETLFAVIEALAVGENVAVITNHGEIYDIGLVLGALRVSLARLAAEWGEQPLPDSCFNIILHRMLSQLGVRSKDGNQASAVSILQLVGNIFLSFPRTESSKKSTAAIPAELIDACNAKMLAELDKQLSEGGQILAFAPSGSKDEPGRNRFGQRIKVIKPVNKGTFSIMQRPGTKVLAVSVHVDGPDKTSCIISELTSCNSDAECIALLNSIAENHTKLSGIETRFASSQAMLEKFRQEAAQAIEHVEEAASHTADRAHLTRLGTFALGMVAGAAVLSRLQKRKRQ